MLLSYKIKNKTIMFTFNAKVIVDDVNCGKIEYIVRDVYLDQLYIFTDNDMMIIMKQTRSEDINFTKKCVFLSSCEPLDYILTYFLLCNIPIYSNVSSEDEPTRLNSLQYLNYTVKIES